MLKLLSITLLLILPISSQATKLTSVELEKIRAKHKIPGLAVIFSDGSIDNPKTLVAGLRKMGSPDKIQETDKFYLGSVVKSMTATLVAKMVEEGKISFDATVGDLISDGYIHPENRAVTIVDLLGHRGGFEKQNYHYSDYLENYLVKLEGSKKESPQKIRNIQRQALLANFPYYKPNSKFEYSNVGYHIAGNLLESRLQISFEKLLKEKLLSPLGMSTCGYGIAAKEESIDQPWGHVQKDGNYIPTLYDLPLYGLPSGKVHCSMKDVYSYLREHLLGHHGKGKYLSKESYLKLHTTYSGNKDYGLGWVIEKNSFWHSGSNGTHLIEVTIWPKSNHIVAVASNSDSEDSENAVYEVLTKLSP